MKNYQLQRLHSGSSAPCSNHAKIRTNLICTETTVHWPHFCRWHFKPMFIQSRMVSSASNSTRYVRHAYRAEITLSWIGYSGLFKVIIGIDRNPERGVVVMYRYINVDFIFDRYGDISTGNCTSVHFNSLTQVWRQFSEKSRRISTFI